MTLTDGHRAMVAFGLHGASVGSIYTRLPEIQATLGLSEAAYGTVQLGFSAGVFLGNIAVPMAIDRHGGRRVVLWSLPVFAALSLLSTLSWNGASLLLALAVFGVALAAGNVAINVVGSAAEVQSGKRIMNRLHGTWGIGFLAISAIAPGLIALGVSPAAQFAGLAIVTLALAVTLLGALPADVAAPDGPKGPSFVWPTGAVWLIGAAALAGVIFEGLSRTWGVIYLRDALGAPEALAAAALPAFIVTLTIARFVGDAAVVRFGAAGVGRSAALTVGAGAVLVLIAPGALLALLGFALIGLGCSVAVPLGFSAAGRQARGSVAMSLAAFSMLTMIANALGPPVFGMIAEATDLRTALAVFLPVVAVSVWQAGRLGERG